MEVIIFRSKDNWDLHDSSPSSFGLITLALLMCVNDFLKFCAIAVHTIVINNYSLSVNGL